ncbi:MAG: DUF2066 domain-containing protein [Woeseiaceae bacterium]
MLNSQFLTLPGVVKYRARMLAVLLLAATIFAASTVRAVEVATLYTAQVALDPDQDNPRSLAYEAALVEVLMRVSGSELSRDKERVELLFPNPASYVVQFRPGDDDTLWVSFDGEAIESVLRQAGQTVWSSDRPETLIWLAVDWGQGSREILGADDPQQNRRAARSIDRNRLLRQRIVEMAERRGLPVLFPLLDTEDLQKVAFSDIWGGFDEALLEASQRYEVHSILVGRIRPASNQRNRWSYHFGGDERSWTGEPEQVIGLVADLLAGEFAVSGSAPLEFVALGVSGVDSVEAYGALQNMLSGTNVIENFSISEVAGDRIEYRVEARGGADRLRRALRFNGLIEQNGFDGDRFSPELFESTLEFFYNQ